MVKISAAKAKRLGIAEDKRLDLSRSELTAAETKSGQYDVTDGKTTLKREEEVAPVKAEPVIKQAQVLPTIELGQKPQEATTTSKVAKAGLDIIAGKQLPVGVKEVVGQPDTEAISKTDFGKILGITGLTAEVVGGVIAGKTLITLASKAALIGQVTPEVSQFPGLGLKFATNTKTLASSTSMLMKIGVGVGAASLLIGAIGSYPFAGFLKEEALQALSLPLFKALEAGDLEGAERLIGEVDDILDNRGSILSKIPYANVMESVSNYFDAAAEANEEWRRILEIKQAEAAGTAETPFARERREADEAAFERKREFGAEEEERYGQIQQASDLRRQEQIKEDEERFAGIRETAGEERATQIAEEEERFAGIREASQQRELDELRFKEQYFALIREGKYDEAAALLDAYEATLKGGR